MAKPVAITPPSLQPICQVLPGPIPAATDLGITKGFCPTRLRGGREAGLNHLDTFLQDRGEPYQEAMSSPLTVFASCSRLSPHLAFGTVAMRETYQSARRRQDTLRDLSPKHRSTWPACVRSFLARLHWPCHFMQKLEDEPGIEFRCFHPAYEGVRRDDLAAVERWATGQTGIPFVDACMRALAAHGWINFRMRAMSVSFATFHLWRPWRSIDIPLARMFTDYEPGLHSPQLKMQ